ncbi:MAG TPA: MarC family protein [Dehalococcoidia bacterium]|nr:MarC family protein [Dehalococcoidia bacterium]
MDDYARALVSFFAIIDPIGNLLVFALLSRGLPRQLVVGMAGLSNAAALATISVFVFGGQEVLDYLDISEASFQIAAGVLLLFPAYRLVEHGEPLARLADEGESAGPYQLALVPLAIPLLAGPAALATAVTFGETSGRLTTLAAAATVLAGTTVLFVVSDALVRVVGTPALRVAARIVGVLLMAIAADLIVSGLDVVFE